MLKINRPLSPHLYVYRFQLTSLLSICHRITGSILALCCSLLLLILCLDTILTDYYLFYKAFYFINIYLSWWLWSSLINVVIISSCFHFLNGLRHLIWDLGFGLDIKNVSVTGLIVLVITSILLCIILYSNT